MHPRNKNKMGRRNKTDAKKKHYKTVEERTSIANDLMDKLRQLGLSEEFECIKKFAEILDEYKASTNVSSHQGKIKCAEIQRVLLYSLPITKGIEPSVSLKIDANQ